MQIVNWNKYEGCIAGSKQWGKIENGEFILHISYKEGDFPIVWCDHDECPCTAVNGQEYCIIYTKHKNE